jgi:3-dehydroquinate synthase
MLVAAELGVRRGVFAEADRDGLAALITKMGPLPPVADLSTAQVLEAVARDKKVIAGQLHYVLPTAIGATAVVTDVTSEELSAALAAIGLRA